MALPLVLSGCRWLPDEEEPEVAQASEACAPGERCPDEGTGPTEGGTAVGSGSRVPSQTTDGNPVGGVRGPEAGEQGMGAPSSPEPMDLDESEESQFPWPPPEPTTLMRIPPEFLPPPEGTTLLGDVANALYQALSQQDYQWYSWFPLPQGRGFALVTQIEQIHKDGTPAQSRWSTDPVFEFRSMNDVLDALFKVAPGRFRVIVFFVAKGNIPRTGDKGVVEEMDGLAHRGALQLEEQIASEPYTAKHFTTAFIYEFVKHRKGGKAKFVKNSELSGEAHLRGAGLLSALEGLRDGRQ